MQWNLHEPHHGNFTFADNLDVEAFLEEAHALGFVVLLRAGPYVCGEVNSGGLPFWLKQQHPDVKLRTDDPKFIQYVDKWWKVMLPKLKVKWFTVESLVAIFSHI